MRQYETVFLISPNLSEEETESLIKQMADVVSKKKGKIINKEEWGKKKLSYPIKKFEEAFYVLFHYEGKLDLPAELERRFKQTESILRYLTIRKEMKEDIRGKKKAASVKKEEAVPVEEAVETTEKIEEEMTESEEEEK